MSHYIGRFAPSPSGPLHFGSILAALSSFLQARSKKGQWLVRMEDIDIPRIQPGAADNILRTLEYLHLFWDGEIVYQSRRNAAYREAEAALRKQQLLYPCACSRSDIQGQRYPGRCRNGLPAGKVGRSVRVRTNNEPVIFNDLIQGRQSQCIESEIGDYIIRRADNITAYHLAVVVDDAWQGITEVMRGSDLMDSTPRQIYLQRLLGYPTPAYAHIPVAVNENGKKISKQHHAPAVQSEPPARLLYEALRFLGQNPAPPLANETVETVVAWGMENWKQEEIPRKRTIPVTREQEGKLNQA